MFVPRYNYRQILLMIDDLNYPKVDKKTGKEVPHHVEFEKLMDSEGFKRSINKLSPSAQQVVQRKLRRHRRMTRTTW